MILQLLKHQHVAYVKSYLSNSKNIMLECVLITDTNIRMTRMHIWYARGVRTFSPGGHKLELNHRPRAKRHHLFYCIVEMKVVLYRSTESKSEKKKSSDPKSDLNCFPPCVCKVTFSFFFSPLRAYTVLGPQFPEWLTSCSKRSSVALFRFWKLIHN